MEVLDGPEFIYIVTEVVPYFTIEPTPGIYVTYFPPELKGKGKLPAKELVVGPWEQFMFKPIV